MPIADRQFFHTVHVHICEEDKSDPIHASRHTDVMCLPLPVSLGDSLADNRVLELSIWWNRADKETEKGTRARWETSYGQKKN
jgi:hypothetical protein